MINSQETFGSEEMLRPHELFSSQDVRFLTDVGFIAWSRGLNAEAAKIFEAVRLLRPNEEAGYIGAALVDISLKRPAAAVALLRKVPPSDTARLFLGLALLNLGERDEAADVLDDVARRGGDGPSGRLARSLLAAPMEGER